MFSRHHEAASEKWYDRIRLQISAGDETAEEGRRALVVALTSINPGDGVTTVALGLSKSFQRSSNERVLMILAKETPEQLERLFIGVKPHVIDDAMLLSEREPAEGQITLLPPYVVVPEAPSFTPATGDEGDPDQPPVPHLAALQREGEEASHGNGGAAYLGQNVDVVVEHFGGTRPMARVLDVPVSTVASWKRRGKIPENRRQTITELLEQETPGPDPEAGDQIDFVESAEAELLAIVRGQPSADDPSGTGASEHNGSKLSALETMEFFGGVRPLARLAGLPVSTVNGWKRRDSIPKSQIPAILVAARSHEAREKDESDQWEPAAPYRHHGRVDGPESPTFMRPERPKPPGQKVLPAWYPESEFRRRGFIVSLGQWGPHVMAIGARGLERSGYGGNWDETFGQLCASYSVIVVDAGSLESHVPFLWRDKASQMLLVVDSARTTIEELREFKRFSGLSKLQITGTILNNMPG